MSGLRLVISLSADSTMFRVNDSNKTPVNEKKENILQWKKHSEIIATKEWTRIRRKGSGILKCW